MVEDIPVAGTPLDPGHFSGKRHAPRARRVLPVECRGVGSFLAHARTVDISRCGMLLEMLDQDLRIPPDASRLMAFATRIMALFPDGIDASFLSDSVRVKATLVRLVSDGVGASTMLIGCRFEPPLEAVDCRLLGLEVDGDETVARASAAKVPEGEDALAFLADLGNPWTDMLAEAAASAPPTTRPVARDHKDEARPRNRRR